MNGYIKDCRPLGCYNKGGEISTFDNSLITDLLASYKSVFSIIPIFIHPCPEVDSLSSTHPKLSSLSFFIFCFPEENSNPMLMAYFDERCFPHPPHFVTPTACQSAQLSRYRYSKGMTNLNVSITAKYHQKNTDESL